MAKYDHRLCVEHHRSRARLGLPWTVATWPVTVISAPDDRGMLLVRLDGGTEELVSARWLDNIHAARVAAPFTDPADIVNELNDTERQLGRHEAWVDALLTELERIDPDNEMAARVRGHMAARVRGHMAELDHHATAGAHEEQETDDE